MFQKHPLYKDCPQFLQLILYFDDVEVCNPLAGYAGIHKLGNVIIPSNRSIHLLVSNLFCLDSNRDYDFLHHIPLDIYQCWISLEALEE